MKRRVAIIGTGRVGSSVAISTLHSRVAADLLQCLLRDERRVLTVSRTQDGALGIRHVALSLPVVVGSLGAVDVLEPEISTDARQQLERSADVLRTAAASLA
jgi:L-lactate dehydrogenase